ncbi:MAG: DUF5686 family protein, partial [Candidatus Zixiibacteriota bacterium]
NSLAVLISVIAFGPGKAETVVRKGGEVVGEVCDAKSGEPVSFATVRVVGTGKSTLANENGRYRLVLPIGEYELKFSHIGYFSVEKAIDVGDSVVTADICLQPTAIEIRGMTVFERAYDPAQRIIAAAIRRKKDILSEIHDYQFDAYSRLTITDISKKDTSKIFLIAESQTTGFWEQPNKYKEVITARRQTSNIPAAGNLMTVGEILNFNKNRLEVGDYLVVSPTATDAMDYYNYYLMDTVFIDSQRVFVLEIEPKNQVDPLFTGSISIVDSTFDVVVVDVGPNEGIRLPFVDSLRYRQRLAQFDNRYWMPVEIRFSGIVKIKVPGIPPKLAFDNVNSLYDYRFQRSIPKGTFDQYAIEVDKDADDYDSTLWHQRQTIPLTSAEQRGYERIDSLEKAPKPIGKQLLRGLAVAVGVIIVGDQDIFHYNRVDGPYLGLGLDFRRQIPNTRLWLAGGYPFERKDWAFRVGISRDVLEDRRLALGLEYRNQLVSRPAIIAGPRYNPTAQALIYGIDPLDYYHEKGFSVFVDLKPIAHTGLRLSFDDFNQMSEPVRTEFSIFKTGLGIRPNPPIADGDSRSMEASFSYDSRMLINNKGIEFPIESAQYTRLNAGVRYSSPDFAGSDYDFTRYFVRLYRRQRIFGLGSSAIDIYWGQSSGRLPPQNLFTLDHADPAFATGIGFKTLDANDYYGDRAISIYVNHNFRRLLFGKSRLPLIRKIPFDFSIHGGAFWTEFKNGMSFPQNAGLRSARTAYSELGFMLLNLTPFLAPFNFALAFTWQLSDYDTSRFAWQIGLKL